MQPRQLLADLAKAKNTNPSAIALAWILHHPAGIVPIIGSTKPEHIVENCAAETVRLTRQEWYDLFGATIRAEHARQLQARRSPQRMLTGTIRSVDEASGSSLAVQLGPRW
jgi:diketogulonate reductase-like aldo/keto reductase